MTGEGGGGERREIKGDITQQYLLLRNREGTKGRKPRNIARGTLRVSHSKGGCPRTPAGMTRSDYSRVD